MRRKLGASLILITLAVLTAGVIWRAQVRETAAEAAAPPEGAFATVNGQRVHYVTRGSGPDLVLIHGAGGSTREFTLAFADLLTDRYRVTMVDRPGHGYTDVAPDHAGAFTTASAGPSEQAALIRAATQQIGVETPLVMGHSFGGAVALAWAVDAPDTMAGLVMVSGVSNPWPGDLNWTYKLNGSLLGGALAVPLVTAFYPRSAAEQTANGVFAPQSMPDGYADYTGIELVLRRQSLRANARQVLQLRPHVVAQSAHYGQIDMPVEIIHGTADDIVPLAIHSAPLSQQIPGAVLTELDQIGHMPHHVAARDVVAAIDRAASRAGLR